MTTPADPQPDPQPGKPSRRELFLIHPEILRGVAGYRRLPSAPTSPDPARGTAGTGT